MSNGMREIAGHLCNGAGMTARYEANCFPSKPNFRIDVLATDVNLKHYAIDVACTHRRMDDLEGYGVATKGGKYGELVALESNMELVPLVCGTMGAWSATAQKFLGKLSRRYASRMNISQSRALSTTFSLLNNTLARGVARILVQLVSAADSCGAGDGSAGAGGMSSADAAKHAALRACYLENNGEGGNYEPESVKAALPSALTRGRLGEHSDGHAPL
jgi:hypothetical protein